MSLSQHLGLFAARGLSRSWLRDWRTGQTPAQCAEMGTIGSAPVATPALRITRMALCTPRSGTTHAGLTVRAVARASILAYGVPTLLGPCQQGMQGSGSGAQ